MSTTAAPSPADKPWTLPAKRLPNQFHHLHRFIVVGRNSMVAVEGHYSEAKAQNAADVLSEHNERNGHAERFAVYPLPVPLHNQPPERWDSYVGA